MKTCEVGLYVCKVWWSPCTMLWEIPPRDTFFYQSYDEYWLSDKRVHGSAIIFNDFKKPTIDTIFKYLLQLSLWIHLERMTKRRFSVVKICLRKTIEKH